jgi:hypothetical protein
VLDGQEKFEVIMDNTYITKIFEGGSTGNPLDEIISLSSEICPTADHLLLRNIYKDLRSFFSGSHLFFQKNSLQYHDLRHSQMVVLATIRLLHGLHCNHVHISEDMLTKSLLSACFHDTGMLLLNGDTANSGTEYIARHEERSILFLDRYITHKNLDRKISKDCATIIHYTNLSLDPATFDLHSLEVQLAGQVVGSADILAQMADRYYLEALPVLYRELKDGSGCQYTSALNLMEHTANFYHNVIQERLVHTFSNISQSMRLHFYERYKIDRNLYAENIRKNITYLEQTITQCKTEFGCMKELLQRRPPTI